MHISVDQTFEVAQREDARIIAYLDRLDLRGIEMRRGPHGVASLMAEAGLVRLPGLVPQGDIVDGLVRCYVQIITACPAMAFTGRAWVEAARRFISGRWQPSKWTVVEKEEVHIHVHVRRV